MPISHKERNMDGIAGCTHLRQGPLDESVGPRIADLGHRNDGAASVGHKQFLLALTNLEDISRLSRSTKGPILGLACILCGEAAQDLVPNVKDLLAGFQGLEGGIGKVLLELGGGVECT